MVRKGRVEELAETLQAWSDAYYNGEPAVTDAEFDTAVDELRTLDPAHPFLSQVGAPVQSSVWPKRKHSTLMGSLAKVNFQNEWEDWANGSGLTGGQTRGDEYFISEKADGSTIVASYKLGKLVALATRGDGIEGEDITPNAAHLPSVKQELPEPFTGDLRGEAVLRRSVFDKYFAPVGYKNPRNAANGKIREQKDVALIKHIEVFWFDVLPQPGSEPVFKTEADKYAHLKKLGLNRIPAASVTRDKVWKVYQGYVNQRRASLDYEIDGLVVKVSSLEKQSSFGMVGGRPKGSVALKFPAQEKTTTLLNVEWQRGLKRRFTPVGILAPVDVGGVTITRCSLHGMDNIRRLQLKIGDKVVLVRANDVIPQIVRRIGAGDNSQEIVAPDACDACEERLITEILRDGRKSAYLLCPNPECPGDLYGRLVAWMRQLNIMGIGPSIVEGLIKAGIKDIDDLYTAPVDTFNKGSGSEKIGAKIYANLHAAKKVSLATFLSALSVPTLGNTNGQRMEQRFTTLEAVMAASALDIETVPGIKTNSVKIHKGLQAKREMITRLSKLLTIEAPGAVASGDGPLSGSSFCITGALSKPRKEIAAWIKQNGGEVRDSVARGLSYLVTDDPNSGSDKNAKADKLGVKKITETQLYELGKGTG